MKSKISLVLAIVMILSFSVMSLGAAVVREIKAYVAEDMKFQVDGEMWQPKDLDGTPLAPIIYNGRSYVPARALLEEKDVKVNFDDETRTIILNYPDWQDPDEDNGKTEPPKDQRYWDPDAGKYPDIGDIIAGPIVWRIGGPYEELPDYTLILEEFAKLSQVMESNTITMNLDKDAVVMISGREWKIEELVKAKKTFSVTGDSKGEMSFKGDKKSDTIKLVQFDGKEIKEGDAVAQKIKWEVSFSGPPFKITITIRF